MFSIVTPDSGSTVLFQYISVVPGRNRILIINIKVQHSASSKAVKQRFKFKKINIVTFRPNLRYLQTRNKTPAQAFTLASE